MNEITNKLIDYNSCNTNDNNENKKQQSSQQQQQNELINQNAATTDDDEIDEVNNKPVDGMYQIRYLLIF